MAVPVLWFEQLLAALTDAGADPEWISPEALKAADGKPIIEPAPDQEHPERKVTHLNLKQLTDEQKEALYDKYTKGEIFVYQYDKNHALTGAKAIVRHQSEPNTLPKPVAADVNNPAQTLTEGEAKSINEGGLAAAKKAVEDAALDREASVWFETLTFDMSANGYDLKDANISTLFRSTDDNLVLQTDEVSKYDPLSTPFEKTPAEQKRKLYQLAKENKLILLEKTAKVADGYHLVTTAQPAQEAQAPGIPTPPRALTENIRDISQAALAGKYAQQRDAFQNTVKAYNESAKYSEADIWYDSFLATIGTIYDVTDPNIALALRNADNHDLVFAKDQGDLLETIKSGRYDLSKADHEHKEMLYKLAKESKLVVVNVEDGVQTGRFTNPEDGYIISVRPGVNAGGLYPSVLSNISEDTIGTINRRIGNNGELTAEQKSAKTFTDQLNTSKETLRTGFTDRFATYAIVKDMIRNPNVYADDNDPNAVQEHVDFLRRFENKRVQSPNSVLRREDLSPEDQETFDKMVMLDTAAKTLTDMFPGHKGMDLRQMMEDGVIADSGGNLFEHDPKNPYDRYEKLYNALNNEECVYVLDPADKDKAYQQVTIDKDTKRLNKDPKKMVLMNPKIKKKILGDLSEIKDELSKMSSKDPDFKELQKKCADTIADLKKTTVKADFMNKLGDFTEHAERYYAKHAGLTLRPKHAKKVQLTEQLRSINDAAKRAVKEDNEALYTGKEPALQGSDYSRRKLAEKYVRGMSAIFTMYGDTQEIRDKYKDISSDPEKFHAKVEEVMTKDAPFRYLYGGNDPESLRRIDEGLKGTHTELFSKTWYTKASFADPETRTQARTKLEHDRIMAQRKAPHNRRQSDLTHGPVDRDVQEDIRRAILDAKSDLMKTNDAGSPEYQAFARELRIAAILMNDSGSLPIIDFRKTMADLAEKADRYVEKRTTADLSKTGRSRYLIANKIRHLTDALENNQNINEVDEIADPQLAEKKTLADRIASASIDMMIKSDDPVIQERGKRMEINPDVFEQQRDRIMNSKVFKEMYEQNPNAVYAALKEDPAALVRKVGKAELMEELKDPQKAAQLNKAKEFQKTSDPVVKEDAPAEKKEEKSGVALTA